MVIQFFKAVISLEDDDSASIASKTAPFGQQDDINDRENSPSPLLLIQIKKCVLSNR